MGTKHLFISDLNFNYKLWQSELSFYLQEINIYEEYLSEVAHKWTDKSVKAQVEHFQNQFIIQREQNEILTHDLKIKAEQLAAYAKHHETAINHVHFDKDTNILSEVSERVESFKNIFSELKTEFKKFLSKYL
jgi:hypothetical protein